MRRFLYSAVLILSMLDAVHAEDINDYVSATVTAGKNEVFKGEPFEIYLTVTSHSVTLDREFSMDPFSHPALKQLPADTSYYPVEKKVMNDRIEETRKFSWPAVGVSTGRIDLSNELEFYVLSRNTSLFFSRPKKTAFSIPAQGETVTIKPLPEQGRPADFSGAVGQFSLKVKVTPREAAPGDVIRIRTEVSGEGILDNVAPPLLTQAEGLKIYDPRMISPSPSLVYEQQVIPQSMDAMTLPEVSFCFFDPARGVYRTLKQGPFEISYKPETIGDDVRFRPDEQPSAPTFEMPGPPVSTRAVLLAAGIAGLALILLLFRLRHAPARTLIMPAAALAALIVAASVYLGIIKTGCFRKNIFRMESAQRGMIAPSKSSLQTLSIPEGAYVKFITSFESWALVSYAGKQCWTAESALGALPETQRQID